jgi:predicted Zn-dependent peptidase
MVLSTLFGGGMSSRLFQEVREKRGLVYSVYSFVSAYADGGLFGIYAGTGEAEAAELMPVVCDEMAKLTRDIEESEASILMSRESTGACCEQLAQQLLIWGRPIPPEEMLEKIVAVDLASLGRLAGRLVASRPCFAALGPLGRVESFDCLAGRLA